MPRPVWLLIALAGLLPATATANPILINGSFELGPPIPTNDMEIAAGSTAITGWTVFGSTIDYIGPPWDVSDGQRAIDLDGRNSIFSGIQQTFATTVGHTYVVSFDLSGNPQGGPDIKGVRVGAANFSADYFFDSTGQTLDALLWQSLTFSFVATDATTTLAFMSLSSSPNSYGALIDDVSVSAVSEPSTALLMLLGASVALVRWNARRSAVGR